MKITIEVLNPETGNPVASFTFTNSIDANAERDRLEHAELEYRVTWNC